MTLYKVGDKVTSNHDQKTNLYPLTFVDADKHWAKYFHEKAGTPHDYFIVAAVRKPNCGATNYFINKSGKEDGALTWKTDHAELAGFWLDERQLKPYITLEDMTERAVKAEKRVAALEAARQSYADLFDGDVGSIHENIRNLKNDTIDKELVGEIVSTLFGLINEKVQHIKILKEAGFECRDKLWVIRCDTRSESLIGAIDYAIKMSQEASGWKPEGK